MYLKSGFDPEVLPYISVTEYPVDGTYQVNDSFSGEAYSFAIPSAYTHTPGHFFYIPAAPFDLGRIISVYIQNPISSYCLNPAFPSVLDLFVTVTSRICKVLSRVFYSVRKRCTVKSCKKSFTVCRPCVLRL